MDSRKDELIEILQSLVVLLERRRETHWCAWMTSARDRLINSDYSGVKLLLKAYGGMGSFNDTILRDPDDDARLEELRGRLAIAIPGKFRKMLSFVAFPGWLYAPIACRAEAGIGR